MLELLLVEIWARATCAYWGRLHVYADTCVTAYPCSEHVESLACVCGSIVNVVHGGVILCDVVSEFEISCSPEVSELFL